MQDSQVELKNKRDAEKKRSNKLRDLNTQIESLETELASLDTTDVQVGILILQSISAISIFHQNVRPFLTEHT